MLYCIFVFRLSKHKLEKLWAEHIGSLSEHGETYKGFSGSYWCFSRQPIVQSLSRLSEQDEQIALQMFQIILKYAGLGQNGNRNDKQHNYNNDNIVFRPNPISLSSRLSIRRSGPEGRRRTHHADTDRDGEGDAQGVDPVRTVPAADQTDHGTSGPEFAGQPQALGAVVVDVFGHLAAAAEHSKVFDSAFAQVCRRLRDRGGEVRSVCRKSEWRKNNRNK